MELRMEAVTHRLRAMLAETDEPLCAYVYDLEALRRHARAVTAALPDRCELFYAIKANSDLPVLRTLAPIAAGWEVSSGGELAWVREHFPDLPVIFSGPGKTDDELRLALRTAVDDIHVVRLQELLRLAWMA